jgi:hypothetical protein
LPVAAPQELAHSVGFENTIDLADLEDVIVRAILRTKEVSPTLERAAPTVLESKETVTRKRRSKAQIEADNAAAAQTAPVAETTAAPAPVNALPFGIPAPATVAAPVAPAARVAKTQDETVAMIQLFCQSYPHSEILNEIERLGIVDATNLSEQHRLDIEDFINKKTA